ncbi:MAG TPA: UbiH/UbiF family hydroxylase [Burkholderiales bacterium]|nr:UbiH/UbiF family hydroxylase [Burkholderiales bacterium]
MEFDVAIVGGGPVGAALGIALARGGLRVTVIESREPVLPTNEQWDARVYAVSPGSRDFIAGLHAWESIGAERIAPIGAMQVWGDDGVANIGFDALEAARDDLGCIVEAGRLQLALWDVLRNEPNVTLHCPARCQSLAMQPSQARLTLTDGQEIEAALLVGADGADSWVRNAAGLTANMKPYGQAGVVANFVTERSHQNIARQWFRHDGVIAYLPLPGNRISIVWSAQAPVAEELLALKEAEFCERVALAGNDVLGALKLITPPASFPLRLVDVPHTVKPAIALLGDAAHVVHPLAGQGVNLGLRDVQALADVLLTRGRHEALGDLALLRRYERARREDWLATKWVTDGLHSLFHPERSSLSRLRNMGLALTNRMTGLKRHFMAHAVQ